MPSLAANPRFCSAAHPDACAPIALHPRHPNPLRPAVLALGIRLLAAWLGWLLSPAFAFAGPDNTPRPFRVQAGPASETLKQFAEQAQREILFPSEPLADVRTPRVFGDYPPREALDRLLAGTRLRAREAPETGGFVISTAANTPPQARPDNSPSTITTTSPMKKTSMLTVLISQLGLAVTPLTTTASAAAPPDPDPDPAHCSAALVLASTTLNPGVRLCRGGWGPSPSLLLRYLGGYTP